MISSKIIPAVAATFTLIAGSALADTLVEPQQVAIDGPVLLLQSTALTVKLKPARVYNRLIDGHDDDAGYAGGYGMGCQGRKHSPSS